MKKLLLLWIPLLFLCTLTAQIEKGVDEYAGFSWKKHYKLAEKLYVENQYSKAAFHFESAWQQKRKKLELINKAGECYIIVKNYEKAIEAFEQLQVEQKRFPKAQYLYAKALKQNEDYLTAIEVFQNFIQNYEGENAASLILDAQEELKGAEFALQNKKNVDASTRIKHLGGVLNSDAIEFAPMPFGNDELLFSTTKSGRAKIFETKRNMRSWDAPKIPAQFAIFEEAHVCNASLSPDEKRMYFTVCKSVENWGALTTRCEIYFSRRVGNLWGSPERLPDNINRTTVTSTHPTVVHSDNKEIIYFASNRTGGQGGMDIWYTTRDLGGGDLNFSDPRNLGAKINTAKNEITPFFDADAGMLYFSSDGHLTIGGLDILQSSGQLNNWELPENLGMPFNSGADDYFYIQNRYGDGGFMVSNRTAGTSKISTEHEDIFEFTKSAKQRAITVRGNVMSSAANEIITNAEVSIYEVLSDNKERLLKTSNFINGQYRFKVIPNTEYRIVALKAGYQPNAIFLRPRADEDNNNKNIELVKINADVTETTPPVIIDPPVTTPTPTPKIDKRPPEATPVAVIEEYNEGDEYTYTPSEPLEAFKIRTNAPRHQGIYYKVQLIAVGNFSRTDVRFKDIKNFGRIDYEFLVDRGITRVLLADFFDKADALDAVNKANEYNFNGAFIVKYKDGERVGQSR